MAALLYLAATLVFWARLFLVSSEEHALLKLNVSTVLSGGAAFHLLSLAGQGPVLFSMRAGVIGLFGWFLIVSFLLAQRRSGVAGGAIIAPIALCATLYSLAAPQLHSWTPTDRLGALWLVVHVFVILAAYVALAFAFAFSLLGVTQERLLKKRQLSGLWQRLPSLGLADEWIVRATTLGVALLTLGLFTGVAFDTVHSHAMLRDPKTMFAGLTWTIFVGYLLARWKFGWHGRRSHWFVIYGFVVLAFSFSFVPHFISP